LNRWPPEDELVPPNNSLFLIDTRQQVVIHVLSPDDQSQSFTMDAASLLSDLGDRAKQIVGEECDLDPFPAW
jgi:hypothetical protein